MLKCRDRGFSFDVPLGHLPQHNDCTDGRHKTALRVYGGRRGLPYLLGGAFRLNLRLFSWTRRRAEEPREPNTQSWRVFSPKVGGIPSGPQIRAHCESSGRGDMFGLHRGVFRRVLLDMILCV